MIIKLEDLVNNPGLTDYLMKTRQEVVRTKSHIVNGRIIWEEFTFKVYDPEIITYLHLKFNLN